VIREYVRTTERNKSKQRKGEIIKQTPNQKRAEGSPGRQREEPQDMDTGTLLQGIMNATSGQTDGQEHFKKVCRSGGKVEEELEETPPNKYFSRTPIISSKRNNVAQIKQYNQYTM
jgi:hypothetical protein